MADQQKVVYDLLNCAIFNDLELPVPPVSRSHRSLMLNISETVRDTQFQWNNNRDLHTYNSSVSFRMILSDLAKYSIKRIVARSLRQLSFLLTQSPFRQGYIAHKTELEAYFLARICPYICSTENWSCVFCDRFMCIKCCRNRLHARHTKKTSNLELRAILMPAAVVCCRCRHRQIRFII